jgi:hypothetical protein
MSTERPRTPAQSKAKSKEDKLDKQLEDSFPASDVPSYSAGSIGAPPARESGAANANDAEVKDAEAKVKSGAAKKPETY